VGETHGIGNEIISALKGPNNGAAIVDVWGECGTCVWTVRCATPSGSDSFLGVVPWVDTHGYSCSSASRMGNCLSLLIGGSREKTAEGRTAGAGSPRGEGFSLSWG